MRRPRLPGFAAALLAALPLAGACPPAGASAAADPAPFGAFLAPPITVTPVDSVVEVTFEVDSTATHFNSYEVTIEYDPAVLAYQSVSEGALMTSACANRFKTASQTATTVTYAHSLLCAGQTVDGPGVLSRFRFLALAPGVSELRIVSSAACTFLDAGVCVSPAHPSLPRQVTLTGAVVAVGSDPTGAGSSPPPRGEPELRVLPNPVRDAATLRVRAPAAGPALLEIADVRGRRVLSRAWSASGAPELFPWEAGGLPAGIYFARLRAGDRSVTARVVLLR
jgi:hypothetical protein